MADAPATLARADIEALVPHAGAMCLLDRVLRWERFRVPQWYNPNHWVAYYDMYRYPENLPPYSLGFLDFWWIDPEAEAELRDAGIL